MHAPCNCLTSMSNLMQVALLFRSHDDLLQEFTYFLPDSSVPQVICKHFCASEDHPSKACDSSTTLNTHIHSTGQFPVCMHLAFDLENLLFTSNHRCLQGSLVCMRLPDDFEHPSQRGCFSCTGPADPAPCLSACGQPQSGWTKPPSNAGCPQAKCLPAPCI